MKYNKQEKCGLDMQFLSTAKVKVNLNSIKALVFCTQNDSTVPFSYRKIIQK